MIYDAIIIGGGAAGLFCAITAGNRGKRVLVVEHNAEVGRKIVISGGGRCNFTNVNTKPENFISQNPHFCKSALAGYTPNDFVDLVRSHRIAFYEKKLGQLFCRESSRQIVEMLLEECRRAKVRILTGCKVSDVSKSNKGPFQITTGQGEFAGNSLVVATGGLSFPKIGATDLGFRIARQFDLKVTSTRPSLVAMVMAGETHTELAGISVDASVSTAKAAFRENILFTHRGLSGPAILQISNYWEPGKAVSIDLVPDASIEALLVEYRNGKTLSAALAKVLPEKLAACVARGYGRKTTANLSRSEIERIKRDLKAWNVSFAKTEGYDRAEVTLGGVSTDELTSKTLESKRITGLYFIGEVVDITGWLGGYNFQWAWSSGFAAGKSI